MAKTSTVSCRIEEDVKNEAEAILQQLGIPVSTVINTLYHQIIIRQGVPFSITIPSENDNFGLTDEELNTKLEHSYQQVLARQGRPLDDVFDDLERKYSNVKL
jgi:addiction module RelB/DinJ family antitoxin